VQTRGVVRGCGGSARGRRQRRGPVEAAVLAALALALVIAPTIVATAASLTGASPAGATQQAHVYSDAGMIGFGSVNQDAPNLPQPLNSPSRSKAPSSPWR
jgi:hypothetical protein